jgi:hypothetical protein
VKDDTMPAWMFDHDCVGSRPRRLDMSKHNSRCNVVVRRACRAASVGTCSAKVLLPQSELSQNNLHTRNRISTSRPAIAVSDSRRSYRL